MYINDDMEIDDNQAMQIDDTDTLTENIKKVYVDYSVPKTRENFIDLTKTVKLYFEPNAKKTNFWSNSY